MVEKEDEENGTEVAPAAEDNPAESRQKIGAGKLDSLPRESLIALIKKQLVATKESRKQAAESKKEIEDLKAQLAGANSGSKNDSLVQMELLDYKKSYDQLKKNHEQVKGQVKEKDELIKTLGDKMQALNEENVDREDLCQQLRHQITRLEKDLEEQSNRLKQGDLSLDIVKKEADEQTQSIKTELEEIHETLERQNKALEESRREAEEGKTEVSRLVNLNELLQRNLDLVRSEFEHYKERAEFLIKQKNEAESDNKIVEGFELEELKRNINGKQNEIDMLNEKISHLQHEISTQKERNQTLKTELQDTRVSLSMLHKDFNEQRKKILTESDDRLKHALQESESLRKELLQVKEKAVQSSRTQNQVSAQQYQQLTTEVEELRRELESVKASKPEPSTASNTLIKPHEHQERPQLNPINFSTENYFNDVRVEERIEVPKEKDLVSSLRDVINNDFDDSASTINIFETDSVADLMFADPEVLHHQLEHTRALLQDTEETNVKLEDQVKLLKEEIRRSEREKERSQHINKNTEYLKNVVMQFLAPERINDARSQLLPVLCTMLSLTSEEKTKVEQYLNTQRTPGTPQSEWSGYFGGLF